ncbi:MAG: hypothetical protein WBW84_11170, partial [Acidobacteriaceae bacterium]
IITTVRIADSTAEHRTNPALRSTPQHLLQTWPNLSKSAGCTTTAFLISELDAPDLYDEYIAISTLADLYGKTGEYGPGIGEFERDRGRYVQLWKAWFRAGAN